ncbi:MAG: tail fiber domain-containing protein, partial [Bacteroidota bacterium]
NTFIGTQAGRSTTTGRGNTFIGADAEANFSSSIYPDFVLVTGAAGQDNATGSLNTYIGAGAGVDSRTVNANTFIGYGAGGNTENVGECTFVGAYAGWDNNRTGGVGAFRGAHNTYLGFGAGGTNRDGSDNVGIGHGANFVETGNGETQNMRNVFIGSSAVINRANDAVLIGYRSVIDNNANRTVAIGSGVDAAGQRSVAIGYLTNLEPAADDAICIGNLADVQALQATAIGSNTVVSGTNSTAIGYQASVAANNEIVLGNSSIASIGGVVNWTATSDGRFKKNVQENVIGLDFINRLRPVTYNYDAKKLHTQKGFETETLADALNQKEAVRYSGFIAQEVEAAAEQLGYDFSGVDAPQDEADIYGLRYAEFVVPLVKAVQELSAEVDQKDKRIAELEAQQAAELAAYKKLLGDLTARVEALEVKEGAELSAATENK